MTKTYVKTNNTEVELVKSGHIVAGKEYEVTKIEDYGKYKGGFVKLEDLLGKSYVLIGTGCEFLDDGLWEVVER